LKAKGGNQRKVGKKATGRGVIRKGVNGVKFLSLTGEQEGAKGD